MTAKKIAALNSGLKAACMHLADRLRLLGNIGQLGHAGLNRSAHIHLSARGSNLGSQKMQGVGLARQAVLLLAFGDWAPCCATPGPKSRATIAALEVTPSLEKIRRT